MPDNSPYALHWFRRDLRVCGNPALQQSWKRTQGRVLGFFCFDRSFLSRPDFSVNRFGFFLKTLLALRDELRSLGGDLLVLDEGPEPALKLLFQTLQQRGQSLPCCVSYNRDYEPFARNRDQRIQDWLDHEFGVPVVSERDHLLIEPHEISRDGGGFYQVYSPFAKRWFALWNTPEIQSRIAQQGAALETFQRNRLQEPLFRITWKEIWGDHAGLADQLDAYTQRVLPQVTVPLPPAGHAAAVAQSLHFQKRALADYHTERDFPDRDGTSRLSIYLKNGSITSAQIFALLSVNRPAFTDRSGTATFVKEIAWREFYYHILYHRPDVESQSFLEKYRHLPWENRADWFDRWKQGTTGFPIVDAGMRQLKETGWMHNRVRMIVASFLTKDLLIDWRWGERYFMETLLDGDLAPNNGGWQWAASTGCDPQPYFRVFNPRLQSEKFDPQGTYIKQYIPELRLLESRDIHAPSQGRFPSQYPQPLVDHSVQKELALAMYRAASEGTPERD